MRRAVLFVSCLAAASGCTKRSESDTGSAQASANGEPSAADQGGAEAEPDPDLPSAQTLIEKAVDAVGGRDKLDAIHSFHHAAEISIAGQNIAGDTKMWWKDGDFYTEGHMAGLGEFRAGKSGDVIWSEDPINGLRKLEGAEAEQQAWASSLMLVADWKSYFESAQTEAQREIDGRKVYDVKLTSDTGTEVLLSFDAESGLQVAQSFEQVTPMGSMPVELKMEDYREVEGVKVAFTQVTDASLAKATQSITKLEINPEVDTSKFAMPTSGADVVRKKTMMPFDADGKPGKPVPDK